MPNRIIKESICTSENLNNLSADEEVFFYRLMVNCEDYGRADARPQILRAKCFPLRTEQIKLETIKRWLYALARAKLIILYEVDGRPYLQMTTWATHQQIRAKKSKFPGPDDANARLISLEIKCNQIQENAPVIVIENENRNTESESYSETERPQKENKPTPTPARSLTLVFEREFGRPLSPLEYEQIVLWQKTYSDDIVFEALKIAVVRAKLNLKYIDSILLDWEKLNLHTLREVQEYERRHQEKKNKLRLTNGQPRGEPEPMPITEEDINSTVNFINVQLSEFKKENPGYEDRDLKEYLNSTIFDYPPELKQKAFERLNLTAYIDRGS